jgi:signal transduction histidine kinase
MSMEALTPARPVAVHVEADREALPAAPAAQSLTAHELAELMAAFNEVTSRLHGTHEALQREVVRLRDELRAANEQLQRSRSLAALGEMAAGIAHEVRNPLGSIRLYARMLEQDLSDRPDERQIAGKIAAAVGGLDAVVGDVLAFAREMRLRPEAADGAQLMTRALELCWDLESSESGIRIVRRFGGRSLLSCDPLLMQQALVNIIRNALEAMAESPPPRQGHELCLECAKAGDELAFRIIDTGPGVSSEAMERMFNPFFTTRRTGTGLGLAIVHRIVDAHGGRIVVHDRAKAGGGHGGTEGSGEARGTIFEMLVPRGEGFNGRSGGRQECRTHEHQNGSGRHARGQGVKEARR